VVADFNGGGCRTLPSGNFSSDPTLHIIMNVDTGQPLTILRIKRKRNEEPVDALVFSDSKRRKKGLDVFHFVQTVEREDSWNTKDIQVFRPISPSCPHL